MYYAFAYRCIVCAYHAIWDVCAFSTLENLQKDVVVHRIGLITGLLDSTLFGVPSESIVMQIAFHCQN